MSWQLFLSTMSWQLSITHYKNALRLKQDYPEALSNLGVIYAKVGQLDEAVKLFEQVLSFRPEDSVSMFNLGLAYEQLSKRKEQPETQGRTRRRGVILKAIEAYEKVLMLEPDNVRARERLGKLKAKSQ